MSDSEIFPQPELPCQYKKNCAIFVTYPCFQFYYFFSELIYDKTHVFLP